jgi:hypothetical protein
VAESTKVIGSMILDMAEAMRDTKMEMFILAPLRQGKLMEKGITHGITQKKCMMENGFEV